MVEVGGLEFDDQVAAVQGLDVDCAVEHPGKRRNRRAAVVSGRAVGLAHPYREAGAFHFHIGEVTQRDAGDGLAFFNVQIGLAVQDLGEAVRVVEAHRRLVVDVFALVGIDHAGFDSLFHHRDIERTGDVVGRELVVFRLDTDGKGVLALFRKGMAESELGRHVLGKRSALHRADLGFPIVEMQGVAVIGLPALVTHAHRVFRLGIRADHPEALYLGNHGKVAVFLRADLEVIDIEVESRLLLVIPDHVNLEHADLIGVPAHVQAEVPVVGIGRMLPVTDIVYVLPVLAVVGAGPHEPLHVRVGKRPLDVLARLVVGLHHPVIEGEHGIVAHEDGVGDEVPGAVHVPEVMGDHPVDADFMPAGHVEIARPADGAGVVGAALEGFVEVAAGPVQFGEILQHGIHFRVLHQSHRAVGNGFALGNRPVVIARLQVFKHVLPGRIGGAGKIHHGIVHGITSHIRHVESQGISLFHHVFHPEHGIRN